MTSNQTNKTTFSRGLNLIDNLSYRPEIDGLRAMAVLAVVFYHAGLSTSGGYIGVDVFFVISGFLITSLIIKDLQDGKFTFSNFWERRARRIIPAMFVVVVFTLVAGWFLLLPADYAELGKSASYQAIFGANIHFWLDSGYFSGAAEEKPLLHTWSLAVEEQFYLFIPLILSGLFRFPSLRKRITLLSLFATGIAMSLAVSIYGVRTHPSAAFYLLPTRAWELLLGAVVALAPVISVPKSRAWREFLSLFGLASILVSCWLYTKNTPFPGLAAVPPCLGTAIFIWSTSQTNTCRSATNIRLPATARLLATRPVVFIGLISYSLYLWHWPLLAFSRYWALEPMTLSYRIGIVALGIMLSILSWRFVETPFRRRTVCATKPAVLTFGVVGIVTVWVSGAVLMFENGFPTRYSQQVNAFTNHDGDNSFHHEMTPKDVRQGDMVAMGVDDSNAPIEVLVWGDSHAMAALPAFDALLKDKGISGRAVTHSATAPVISAYWDFHSGYGLGKESILFGNEILSYIQIHRIPNVVLVARWREYPDEFGSIPIQRALLNTIAAINKLGAKTWVMLEVPSQKFDVPKVLARSHASRWDYRRLLATPTEYLANARISAPQIEYAGGIVLDPVPQFLDPSGGQYYVVEKDGNGLYRDNNHLSRNGALTMVLSMLKKDFCISR